MPIKLIIVDDEPIILEGMKKYVDWEYLDIEVTGCFSDGLCALQYLQTERVDVMITDIKMPGLDGIELSKRTKELYKDIKILFFTGFDEFEYAQKAIEIGAVRYLLKPFTKTEVEETLLLIRGDLEKELTEKKNLIDLRERVRDQIPIIKEAYYNKLLDGYDRSIASKLRNLDGEMAGSRSAVFVVRIDVFPDNIKEDKTIAYAYIKDVVQGLLAGAIVFNPIRGRMVCIVEDMDGDEIFSLCEGLKNRIFDEHGFKVSVGIGNVYEGYDSVHLSYSEALEALEYKFFLGKNIVIAYNDIKAGQQTAVTGEKLDVSSLVRAVKKREVQMISKGIDDFFAQFDPEKISIGDLKVLTKDFISKTVLEVMHNSLVLNAIHERKYDIYEIISNYATLEEMREGLTELLTDISEYIFKTRENNLHFAVKDALEYIDAHYSEEDLSIKDVSQYLSMNASYLSRLFGTETKMTFTEYLNGLRMKKAEELLKNTNLRVSEICYNIGMHDPFYFSTVFKKHSGMSPSDYRDTKRA